MATYDDDFVPNEGIAAEEGILAGLIHGETRSRDEKYGYNMNVKCRRRCPSCCMSLIMLLSVLSLAFFLLGGPSRFQQLPPTVKFPEIHVQQSDTTPPAVNHVKNHIPSRISNVLLQLQESKNSKNDSIESNYENRKPRFHLLIAAKRPSLNLCKTLLSAAALNYPSPVLINYGSTESARQPAAEIIYKTHEFLNGDQAQDNDLIIIAEEDNWFQLPAEVIIGRFLQGTQALDLKLLRKYGRKPPDIDLNSPIIPLGLQRYNQKVLFGAQKECSNSPADLACYSAPQSPLLTEIYGPETEGYPGTILDLPRYLGPAITMGRVADLRSIYSRAKDILETDNQELHHSSHQVLAHIFGKQEQVRSVRAEAISHNSQLSSWTSLLLGIGRNPIPKMFAPPQDIDIKPGQDYEFGVGLDYTGSIFQTMHNSTTDLRFVTFKNPPTVPWPSLPPDSAFENSVRLPRDLGMDSPFTSPRTSTSAPNLPLHPELDNLPKGGVTWQDVELLTNIIVPSSSVPSVVNFQGNESLQNEWWHSMWYQKHGRALLRQRLRDPREGVATKVAIEGEEQWWDFRGGRGGVWTDNGTWLEWNEVCGGFEEGVFGDGLGRFGAELGTAMEDRVVV